MKKAIIVFLILVVCCSFTSLAAFLGVYEPGETIRYTVVCLEDGGKRDTSCTGGSGDNAYVLGPFESSPINSSLSEVSDTEAPGLWRGNFSLGSGNQTGLWSVYINLTNVNGTKAATVLHFQVVGDTHGLDAAGANSVTSLSNQAVLKADLRTANVSIQNYVTTNVTKILGNITSAVSDIIGNLTAASSDIVSRGDSAWITATGFETESDAATRYAGLSAGIQNNMSVLNDSILFNLTGTGFSASLSASDKSEIIKTVNDSVIANLSNDFSFFDPLFLALNASVSSMVADLNSSLVSNLSNDKGFFDPFFSTLNSSLIANITRSVISAAITAADVVSIGKEAAIQVLRHNLTSVFSYNSSSFALTNITYNYSGIGVYVVEKYYYNNESFLNRTVRNSTNG